MMGKQREGEFRLSCPIPISEYPHILLAHGGGGKLMHQLIEKMFLPAFENEWLGQKHDGAVFSINGRKIAFTTDSYVVRPLFFPGGDIGKLAIFGTVNDLAVCGARPLFLSVGFILEEGFPMETLWEVLQSMKHAAQQAGVRIITGDTKVVDKGKGDGIFLNTAGVGILEASNEIGPHRVCPGDQILLSGDIGRHGIAIMAVREGLEFDSPVESDCAPIHHLILSLLEHGIEIHCVRDLTRGGLASALVEIAQTAGLVLEINESAIPVDDRVLGACEILGLDPLYVANEGRFIAFIPEQRVEEALHILHNSRMAERACIIGSVSSKSSSPATARVKMKSLIGATRIVDMLSGEQLPRIC